MLILFDVDATLITTARAGVLAMGEAGREMFGPTFDENSIEYSGRLDPLIIADLLTVHSLPTGDDEIKRFRAAYKRHLARRLERHRTARPCPGVPELLQSLNSIEGLTLGLLTGNYPETGRVKLDAAGISVDRFALRVWGEDSPHSPPSRDHLPEVALKRYAALHGAPIEPRHVVIVGDTPHDVACARACGCRSLAVATGMFEIESLRQAGADHAVDDLSDTESISRWLVDTEPDAVAPAQASSV